MTKTSFISVIIALIIGGVIGYAGAGYQYSAILTKAKEAFPPQMAMTSVSGTIQGISGNTITLNTPQSPNPFVTTPATRTVTVTSSTKIVKSTPVDPTVFQQEMAAYQKAVQKSATSTTATPPPMPMPVTQTTIMLSDLKAGDMVTVDAGKDVSTASSFDAATVTVTGMATTAVPTGMASTTGTAPVVNTPPPAKK
ncbi:MAG TPA: hypothetical protein PLW99_02085 [Candidatus Paceibacterota bacterium]|nr:MAG: hypothetical protein B7X03_03220 [Parcubacteria group bacterium 21-58-10]HQT82920.1 hypothetical protein [Candidatus Paceibacterota bacterium]